MHFIFLWLLSIIISYGITINLYFNIMKDIADMGYIFDVKRIKQLSTDTSFNKEKKTQLFYLIPGFNLIYAINLEQHYLDDRLSTFYQLKNSMSLSRMSEDELTKYQKNHSLNSILFIINERRIIDEEKEYIVKN